MKCGYCLDQSQDKYEAKEIPEATVGDKIQVEMKKHISDLEKKGN